MLRHRTPKSRFYLKHKRLAKTVFVIDWFIAVGLYVQLGMTAQALLCL